VTTPDGEPIGVLLLHNRYRQRGGEDVMFEAESELLERHGHRVARLVVDSSTIPEAMTVRDQVGLAARTVWSRAAARAVRQAIRRFQPDVVHAHNTFPLLSPSVYAACAAARVPIVHTLHNFRLICPSATLFRDGRPCTDCVGRLVALPGVVHACFQASRSRTAVIAASHALVRLRRGLDRVTFIALSDFARDQLVAGGLRREQIHVKPNFVEPDPGGRGVDSGTFLYVGRLSPEKGVARLLEAWSRLPSEITLRVIGDGPMRAEVEGAAARQPNVRYHGPADRATIIDAMRTSRAVVVPSQWFEMAPVTVLEAFGCGVPVIGSRLGALVALVGESDRGLLFDPHDADALADRVRLLHDSPELALELGAHARSAYLQRYRGEENYALLAGIYRAAIDRERRPR
jgi:glycosyltransferase involved in cell wall biosynthesis